MGNIMANTPYGIFGRAYQSFDNPYYSLLPVATIDQIYEGAAKILTVLEGEEIREYEIEIQKIMKQSHPDGKGMVLKITDPEFLPKQYYSGMMAAPLFKTVI